MPACGTEGTETPADWDAAESASSDDGPGAETGSETATRRHNISINPLKFAPNRSSFRRQGPLEYPG